MLLKNLQIHEQIQMAYTNTIHRHLLASFTVLLIFFLAGTSPAYTQLPEDSTSVHALMKKIKLTHKKKPDHTKHRPKPPAPVTTTTTVPTEKKGETTTTVSTVLTKKVLNKHYDIFGWHPYWMGDAYLEYDFKLLSHVAYFSYEVNPANGSAETIHDWLTTPLVDSARASNPDCKILLTITCFGSSDNQKFLSNTAAQITAANTIISLLDQRKADGVSIDFEGVPSSVAGPFTTFLQQFATALHKKNYILTLAIPAIDYNHVYNIAELNKYVDLYVLMGYGYYGSFSSQPGPISPLVSSDQWGVASIDSSVAYYLRQGMPKQQLLVGLPYYGAFWQSQTTSSGDDSLTFLEYLTYTSYMEQVAGYAMLDSLSISSFSDQMKKDIFHHYWGEDTTSLSMKFDWIISKGLKGLGIWALGYDNGRDELWNLLGAKFGTDSMITIPTDSTHQHAGSDTTVVKLSNLQEAIILVNRYPTSILFALLVVFLAAVAGFLSLYFKEDTADLLRQKGLYYKGLIGCLALLNMVLIAGLYFTYHLPVLLLVVYSLFFWCLLLLVYYLIYDVLHPRDIP